MPHSARGSAPASVRAQTKDCASKPGQTCAAYVGSWSFRIARGGESGYPHEWSQRIDTETQSPLPEQAEMGSLGTTTSLHLPAMQNARSLSLGMIEPSHDEADG